MTATVLYAATTLAADLGAQPRRLPSLDIERLGDLAVGAPPDQFQVSGEAARAAAGKIYDLSRPGLKVDQYLESATVTGTLGSEVEVSNRAVWIVRVSGFEMAGAARIDESGKPTESATYHFAYVFIDASTGDFLLTEWLD